MPKEPIDPKIRDGHPPPLRWIVTTKHGSHQVHMVRLIHFDLKRVYEHLAPPGPTNRAVIHQISKDLGKLRDYVDNKTWIQQITMGKDGASYWISIPSFDNEFFATKKRVWNAIIERWPQFLDEEWIVNQ